MIKIQVGHGMAGIRLYHQVVEFWGWPADQGDLEGTDHFERSLLYSSTASARQPERELQRSIDEARRPGECISKSMMATVIAEG